MLLGGEAALSAAGRRRPGALGLDRAPRRRARPLRDRGGDRAELPAADDVLVARGDAFADALAASGLASAEGIPILLVEPARVRRTPTLDAGTE